MDKKLKQKCDALISKKCRAIGRCQLCGSTFGLAWIHYVTRGELRLRYDERNYCCGCIECHTLAHTDRQWFKEQWDRIKGPGMAERLEDESRKTPYPIGNGFFESILGGRHERSGDEWGMARSIGPG